MKNDPAGTKATVLVTVIMLILAMTILSIGILSAMGSQGLLGQNQVNRIKAEQLAKGVFWKYYIQHATSGSTSSVTVTETLDGKAYTATATAAGPFIYGPRYTITTTTNY